MENVYVTKLFARNVKLAKFLSLNSEKIPKVILEIFLIAYD
jgi:hypothetical protein